MEAEKSRKKFDVQFKIDAKSMVIHGGRSVKEVAQDLGIEANVLYRWKRELSREKGEAFPGKCRLAPQEEELRRLRRELEQVKEDREI